MQKPQTGTHRQTAVGELGPVVAAKMSDDDNYILYVPSHSIAECVNKCVHMCIREMIMVMGCLAVVKTIIILKTNYCTHVIYGLIKGLLYKLPYTNAGE